MKNQIPILILQNLVIFPNQEIKLEMSNDLSKKIIKFALKKYNGEIIIVIPVNNKDNIENIDDVQKIASFCKIKNAMDLPNENIRITLRGIKRIKLLELHTNKDEYITTLSEQIENPVYNLDEELAYTRKLKDLVSKYVKINSKVSNSVLSIIKNVSNLSKLTDMISASLEFNFKTKNKLFKESDYYKRARMLITILNNDVMSLELENKIDEEVRNNFNQSEKEIIIKEKIKALSSEIGIAGDKHAECDAYLEKIDKFKIDKKIKNNMRSLVNRFLVTLDSSPEYGNIRAHLDFITSLPWNKSSKDEENIDSIENHLNELHYGLEQAKVRIEEYMTLKKGNKDLNSPVLCLIGPPGTGKTTFAKELASSLKREFIKISVGGLNDSSELVGHRRTYIGASAGKIMEGIRKCGVNNPIILIDEVDKMVKDYKGDPASVLLEILDPNQNKEFIDNYVQEPFDLSNVLFILTANDSSLIPRALYDRLEVIKVSSFTIFDKIEILKNYTLPRLAKEYAFDKNLISISDETIKKIIINYTNEAGVRDLERHFASIIRKVLIKGLDKKITIKESDLVNYLGFIKYSAVDHDYLESGVVNVPACTFSGGSILNIESIMYTGTEKIISTGSLGKVMQESTLIALSYLKSHAKELKLDCKKLSSTLHIHALDGATPKDGPSAGLGITVSIVSEILDIKIPNEYAFTGEITLKGKVLKVGGIKEKLISAYNTGIKRVFIPKDNELDLKNVPKKVIKELDIYFVETFTELYNEVFI